jgi:hypothetical protein
MTARLVAVYHPSAHACIGLCCAKRGGNMPMNIPGSGIPGTNKFCFKLSPRLMSMGGLADGDDSLGADSLLGMPVMMG